MALIIGRQQQAHCSSHRQFAYELTWLPENNYLPGTEVEIRAGLFRQKYEWTIHRMEMAGAEALFSPAVSRDAPDPLLNRKQHIVFKARLLEMTVKAQPVAIGLVATPSMYAGMDLELFVWVREPLPGHAAKDAERFPVVREEGEGCRLTVTAGPAERFSVYSQPAPSAARGTVRTCLVPEDRYGNPSRFARPVDVEWSWGDIRSSLKMTDAAMVELPAPKAAPSERLTIRIRMDELSADENIANGSVDGEYLTVKGNPVLPGKRSGLVPAFGDIHWHTETVAGSDGGRSLRAALLSARDELNMDFAAPSDHSPLEAEWALTAETVDAFNEADRFAVLYGWENSTNRGHENYYFAEPRQDAVHGGPTGLPSGNLADATERLDAMRGVLAVPHHTNITATMKKDGVPMWHQYNWTEPREYRRLVEIVQNRGNQEKNDYTDAWRGLSHNRHASVQDALRTGHRIGFTGGTDNHVGWPGRVLFHDRKSVIMTGVWTERVERGNVFDSLWQRHTWAVCDTRAIVWFALNDRLMGGELAVAAGTELVAQLSIMAEAPLQTVDIVSEGQTVWSSSFSGTTVDVRVPLGKADRSTHYYMRALQRDGGFMYASPIFVATLEE
ncbi:MAG: hypothetical protein J7639_12495 [Paenibacillaceae bacterium]|nr:hypothetical protein [Paenibacillaceae bacterium]